MDAKLSAVDAKLSAVDGKLDMVRENEKTHAKQIEQHYTLDREHRAITAKDKDGLEDGNAKLREETRPSVNATKHTKRVAWVTLAAILAAIGAGFGERFLKLFERGGT